MKWEQRSLDTGPYGLRDIFVYETTLVNGTLVATYLGNRAHGQDLQLAVELATREHGVRPVAHAVVKIHDYEYDRGRARDWLLDMCNLWASGD